MGRWLAPVLLATTTSCFDPQYRDPLCSAAGECPDGWECHDRQCYRVGAVDAPPPDAPTMIDADIPDAGPEPDAHPCPAMFTDIGIGSSRYLVDYKKTWPEAEQACESHGAGIHLVIVDSLEERNALAQLDTVALWVGLSDRATERDFVDVTGARPTYLPWAPNEPNDIPPGEDCVELDTLGFNDNPCDQDQAFVCECDGKMPLPTGALRPSPP